MSLGLDKANSQQGSEPIPAGTTVTLVIKIKPGNTGLEGLLKRSKTGEAEGLDVEYTVLGGDYDGRKLFAYHVLDGTTSGHAKAGEITRGLLRAIFEATNGLDPNDASPGSVAKRASATLAGFHGATFLATVDVEVGGLREDGISRYRDKNVIRKVLRIGDAGYRRLDQPPPMPIERAGPPPGNGPLAGGTAVARPSWAS